VLRYRCSSPNANKPYPKYEANADERGKEERGGVHGAHAMQPRHSAQEDQRAQ